MKRDKLGRFTTEGIKKIKLLDSWDIIGQIDRVNLLIDSHNDLVKRVEAYHNRQEVLDELIGRLIADVANLKAIQRASTISYTLPEKKEEHMGDVAWCNCSCHTKGSMLCPKCIVLYEKEK